MEQTVIKNYKEIRIVQVATTVCIFNAHRLLAQHIDILYNAITHNYIYIIRYLYVLQNLMQELQ